MKLHVSSSPHIRDQDTTGDLMGQVLRALVPTALAGILWFGARALLLIVVGMAAAMVGEALWRAATGQPGTLEDNSAAVTGLLMALVLPPSAPWWLAAVGSLFAVVVVKGVGGGLARNLFNPALTARALLLLLFPVQMTRYPVHGRWLPLFAADTLSAATPLHEMQMPALPEASLWDLFLGNIGGCVGEVSALALVVGGGYLIWQGVISPRIPLSYLGSVALLTLLFSRGQQPALWMLCQLLSGGLLLGAFFMATDYATSPITPRGQVLYGAGCGALTVLFRYTGLFPEGVTYAVLIMNAMVRLLERWTPPRRFGARKGAAQ